MAEAAVAAAAADEQYSTWAVELTRCESFLLLLAKYNVVANQAAVLVAGKDSAFGRGGQTYYDITILLRSGWPAAAAAVLAGKKNVAEFG